MIKSMLMSTAMVLSMFTTSMAADKYMGFQGGVGENGAHSAGVFFGLERDLEQIVIAGEVGYQVGDRDSFTFDGKFGLPLADKVTGYGIVGYGTSNRGSGVRYGLGGKYDINDVYFAGVETIFQSTPRTAETSILARVGAKF